MDLLAWFEDYLQRVEREGDQQRLQLFNTLRETFSYAEQDPQRALQVLQHSKQAALDLGEDCLALVFDTALCEVYLMGLMDVRAMLALATHATVEARKAIYDHCPARQYIYTRMVNAFFYTDPVGYADEILETFAFVEREYAQERTLIQEVLLRRALLNAILGQLDTARDQALQALAYTENDPDLERDTCLVIADVMRRRGDYQEGLVYSQLCADHARATQMYRTYLEQLALQALLYRLSGAESEAQTQWGLFTVFVKLLQLDPYFTTLAILSEYYEVGGELDRALDYNRQALAQAEKSGCYYAITELWIDQARLLGKADMPNREELNAARASLAVLRKPAFYQVKIERVESGDYRRLI
ncbi:MAG: hypothetical protein MUF87_18325 [Anaerolineae bacterium]|jgi:tetratricopeptide (TPR) repeat protein|nr:hypothetical protein [Anaerolineae bacterium]